MARPLALTGKTVLAISDAAQRVRLQLASDGLCALDDEALLLLDVACALAEESDLARRRRQLIEDTGEESPWMARLIREHQRDVEARLAA